MGLFKNRDIAECYWLIMEFAGICRLHIVYHFHKFKLTLVYNKVHLENLKNQIFMKLNLRFPQISLMKRVKQTKLLFHTKLVQS